MITIEGPGFRNKRTNIQGDIGTLDKDDRDENNYNRYVNEWGYTGKGKAKYAYAGPAKGLVTIE